MLANHPYDVVNKVPMSKWDTVNGSTVYLVHTKHEFLAFFELLMSKKRIFFDTETTGFNMFSGDLIVGSSFGWGSTHFYIPCRHVDSVTGGRQPDQLEMDWLRPYYQEFFAQEDVEIVGYNTKFDEKFYYVDDIIIKCKRHDTRILWHLYDENAPGALKVVASGWKDDLGRWNPGIVDSSANLNEKEISAWRTDESKARKKELSKAVMAAATEMKCEPRFQGWKRNDIKKYLKEEYFKDHIYAKSAKDDIHYGFIPIQLLAPYAGVDTYLTECVFDYVMENMEWNDKLRALYANEMELSKVIMDAEIAGIRMDREYLGKMSLDYGAKIAKLHEIIQETLVPKRTIQTPEGEREETIEEHKARWINLGSTDQLSKALVEYGVDLTLTSKKTDKLLLDKKILNKAARKHEIVKSILELRNLEKVKSTYFDSILEKLQPDNILHANFNQNVSTGRMCIAKGSLIQTPCDRSKFPNGIPIEDIKVGDQVYCYDKEGTLHLREVLWAGSKGVKPTVTITWKGQGNKHSGELQLTADHKVRLYDGSWIEAQDLKPNDSIMSLSARPKGSMNDRYIELYGRHSAIREHRFVLAQNQEVSEVVHHKDGNKLNNVLTNLEAMTYSSHAKEHTDLIELDILKARARCLHTAEARAKANLTRGSGKDHPCWKHIPRYTLLKWAALCSGKIREIMKLSGMDFEVLKRKYALEGIDLSAIRKRYNTQGTYITKRMVREASELVQPKSYNSLNIGFYTYKYLLEFYNLQTNHRVVTVCNSNLAEVFDLEIAEFNNFIANELCVHNSSNSPNLTNMPRGEVVRNAFIALNEDYIYVLADYSQVEVRLTAHFSGDPILVDAYRNKQDVHCRTSGQLFGVPYEEMIAAKESKDKTNPRIVELNDYRNIGKTLNFSLIYGTSPQGLSEQIPRPEIYRHLSDEQWVYKCEDFMKSYFRTHLGVKRFINKYSRLVADQGYIENYFGRIRHLPHAKATTITGDSSLFWIEQKAKRQGVNFLIQGCAADVFKIAVVRVANILKGSKSFIISFVHDEIQMYIHKQDIHLLNPIKKAMEDFNFRVPLTVEMDYSLTSWGAKKAIKH